MTMKNITLFFLIMIQVVALNAQNSMVMDASFGQIGSASIAPNNWVGRSLLQQPDGKLIAIGAIKSSGSFTYRDVRLARLLPEGSLDVSFNGTGVVETDLEFDADFAVSTAVLQPDGKILVACAGRVHIDSVKRGILLRYLPDGSLDNSFADGGKWIFSINNAATTIDHIALLADAKIFLLLNVSTGDPFQNDLLIGKLNTDGSTDLSFGQNGFVMVPPNMLYYSEASVLDQAGNLYLLGRDYQSADFTSRLLKFDLNGVLQMDIKLSELTYIPNAIYTSYFFDIDVYPDGRILVGGYSDYSLFTARLLQDGTLDPDYGDAGITNETFGDNYENVRDISLQPDRKILIHAGRFSAARFNEDGSADFSFNGNGLITAALPGGNMFSNNDQSFGVYLQPDGKLLIGGTVGGKLQIFRYVPSSCSN